MAARITTMARDIKIYSYFFFTLSTSERSTVVLSRTSNPAFYVWHDHWQHRVLCCNVIRTVSSPTRLNSLNDRPRDLATVFSYRAASELLSVWSRVTSEPCNTWSRSIPVATTDCGSKHSLVASPPQKKKKKHYSWMVHPDWSESDQWLK